jgi:sugar phosphate isomerase/epimerase
VDSLEIGLCWGSLQKASMLEFIETAARYSFPTITLRPDVVGAALDDGMSERTLRKHISDAGVRVTVIDSILGGLPGQPPPEQMNPAGFEVKGCTEAAAYRSALAVAAPMVNLTHYAGDPTTPKAALAETIQAMCRRAAAYGIKIVLEFVPDTALGSVGAAAEVVKAVGEPNCAITLDPWHLARTGGTVADIRALPPAILGAMQLCDRTPPPPGAAYVPLSGRDLPGEGKLPLCDIVAAAIENQPALSLELEVFSEELKSLSTDAAAARMAAATKTWRQGCGL